MRVSIPAAAAACNLVFVSGALLLVSGCASTASLHNTSPASTVASKLKGNVMGGQSPISGATVQLYAAGSSGYGSGAQALLTPALTTDANGNFTIPNGSYTCPLSNPETYIVATGGNPGVGSNNPAITLMAALGPCDALSSSTYVVINEVTTVAAAFALAPFLGPGAQVGTIPANEQGLTNEFTNFNSLVNIATGTSPGTSVPAGVTVPVEEIYTLADILAACVNSNGTTTCSALFAAAKSTGGSTPTNTLDAALNIARNPGANIAALMALPTAQSPFQPILAAQPSEWTFGNAITYNPALLISSLSPASLPAGSAPQTLTINGTGFLSNSTVSLNGTSRAATFVNAGELTVSLGSSDLAAANIFSVVVANPLPGGGAAPAASFFVGPNGANDGYLNGTYVCKSDSFNDGDDSRGAVLLSIVANETGSLTSGVFDENDRDLSSPLEGAVTGAYSIGADNTGLLTVTTVLTSGGAGSNTTQFAVALNNLAGPTASEFHLVESDDVGSNASGEHGSTHCYLATTSAFASSTLSGNSFAYGAQGEDASGLPEAWVGRFTASTETATGGTGGAPGGSISNGISDGMYIKKTSDGGNVFTGSYTAPDPTSGRFTITITQTVSGVQYTGSYVGYVIDADRMFLLETVGDGGMQAGDMRTQLNAPYSGTSITGSFVAYGQGYEYSSSSESVTGYDSILSQLSGSGTGSFTVNSGYQDENETYQDNEHNGDTVTVTFDPSHPGRASMTVAGSTDTLYAYYFNTGSAFQLDFNGSEGYLAPGWVEPQSQTTFTDAAVAGNYMAGKLPVMEPASNDIAGQYDLLSNGNYTGGLTTAGEGDFSYDQSISGTYNWDTTVTGTGAFLVGSGSSGMSCIVISSTRAACIVNADTSPSVMILQQ
ncbi:MAG: hypothetical protein WB341_16505 [Terracidiphilus sp.]